MRQSVPTRYESAHDPLCPVTRELSDDDSCMGCSLVATVRADEREKAAQRVDKHVLVGMTLTPKEVRMVITAVRGEP